MVLVSGSPRSCRGSRGFDLVPTPRLLELRQAYAAMQGSASPVPPPYIASVLDEIAGELVRREVLS